MESVPRRATELWRARLLLMLARWVWYVFQPGRIGPWFPMASTRPSFPAPSEPNLRRLGTRGGGDRPLRAQLVVAVVGVMLVVAVPLYFLRRPSVSDSAVEAHSASERSRLIRTAIEAGTPKLEVKLGSVQRLKCSAASNKEGNEGALCDRLPSIEAQLEKAIKETVECAPNTGKGGSINYVLSVDFNQKRLNVFPGASGTWKGPQAKAAAKCVLRALESTPWVDVPHNYRYYMLGLMTNYPAPDPMGMIPEFE